MPVQSSKSSGKSSSKSSSAPMFYKASVTSDFGGGRWEGGVATVIKGVGAPWRYPSKPGDQNPPKHTLFGLLTLRDESGEDHEIPYQAGFFGSTDPKDRNFYNNSYPSKDGVMPAGPDGMDMEELLEVYAKLAEGTAVLSDDEKEDYEGPYVVFRTDPESPDTHRKLPKKDWVQLVQSVEELPEFQGENGQCTFPMTDAFDVLVGWKFEFYWEKQKFVSKKMRAQGKTDFEVLCVSRSFGQDEEFEVEDEAEEEVKAAPAKTTSKKVSKPAPVEEEDEVEAEEEVEDEEGVEEEAETEEEDEFGSRVEAAIYVQLKKLGKPSAKRDFNAKVAASFDKKEQLAVLEYLNNVKWMTDSARSFTYENGLWSV